jgi:hypothetical protein
MRCILFEFERDAHLWNGVRRARRVVSLVSYCTCSSFVSHVSCLDIRLEDVTRAVRSRQRSRSQTSETPGERDRATVWDGHGAMGLGIWNDGRDIPLTYCTENTAAYRPTVRARVPGRGSYLEPRPRQP